MAIDTTEQVGLPLGVVSQLDQRYTPLGLDTDAGTAYTPVATATTGALGATSGASGLYWRLGNLVFFRANITIDDVGTATGALDVSLPVTPSAVDQGLVGRDVLTAFLLSGRINQAAFGDVVRLTRFDAVAPAINGSALRVFGWYEAA
jgi:hypothetical protein